MSDVSPAVTYLRDVLGVRSVPKGPSVSAAQAMKNDRISLVISRPITAEEKQLAEKMLAAIDCHDIEWTHDLSSLETSSAVIFGEVGDKNWTTSQVLELPDLAQFFGTNQEVHEIKKTAWEKLKTFKRALNR